MGSRALPVVASIGPRYHKAHDVVRRGRWAGLAPVQPSPGVPPVETILQLLCQKRPFWDTFAIQYFFEPTQALQVYRAACLLVTVHGMPQKGHIKVRSFIVSSLWTRPQREQSFEDGDHLSILTMSFPWRSAL